jgi:hypothetical protein
LLQKIVWWEDLEKLEIHTAAGQLTVKRFHSLTLNMANRRRKVRCHWTNGQQAGSYPSETFRRDVQSGSLYPSIGNTIVQLRSFPTSGLILAVARFSREFTTQEAR